MTLVRPTVQLLCGDSIEVLRTMPDESVQTCVTSPPYYGLRDYGVDGQYGLESTVEEYVARMVEVFAEVRRVLRPDGTLWLNLGDSFIANPKGNLNGQDKSGLTSTRTQENAPVGVRKNGLGLKTKDLIGIPWRVAFALQANGWWLRSDIVWAKPNAMSESVTDRPTRAHEFVFLLTKAERYWYDADAIREKARGVARAGKNSRANVDRTPAAGTRKQDAIAKRTYVGFNDRWRERPVENRNARSVWAVATKPFPEAHFAVMPEELVERCTLAGAPEGATVLDPFSGSGTTAMVAARLGRNAIGIDLNPEYIAMAQRRVAPYVAQARLDTNAIPPAGGDAA